MGVTPEHLHGLVARDAHGRAGVNVAVLLEQGRRRVSKAVDGEARGKWIAVPAAPKPPFVDARGHVRPLAAVHDGRGAALDEALRLEPARLLALPVVEHVHEEGRARVVANVLGLGPLRLLRVLDHAPADVDDITLKVVPGERQHLREAHRRAQAYEEPDGVSGKAVLNDHSCKLAACVSGEGDLLLGVALGLGHELAGVSLQVPIGHGLVEDHRERRMDVDEVGAARRLGASVSRARHRRDPSRARLCPWP